ncbi:MAG: hypothetical protein MRZ79_23975 [Bacteroidia bacterium]|nr:hypothetical protein [Bacteroidia bacterium]
MEQPAKSIRLTYEHVYQFLEWWEEDKLEFRPDLDEKKHHISAWNDDLELIFELKLPLPMPSILPEKRSLREYLKELPEEIPDYTILLVQVGAAAVGFYSDGEAIDHKAIKKYMKRHKRGKAQISYLNTRGKSKAGSRIRLANTVRFFEEINERLTDLEELYESSRILYSITPQLWGLMFASKVPVPFEKKDPRLIKIPRNVHVPDFEEMERLNEIYRDGYLWLPTEEIPEALGKIFEELE